MEHAEPAESSRGRCEGYAELILKLRWIGLDDEARQVQQALQTLPPEERETVSIGPFSTD
jgi:hypothetical protein